MIKLSDNKGVKGKSTDKKIAQLVFDIYTKNALYKVIYNMIKNFINSAEMAGKNIPDNPFNEIDIQNEKPFEKLDIVNSFVNNLKLPPTDYVVLLKFLATPIKSKEIEDKYGISNVTLKARLPLYFDKVQIKKDKNYLGWQPKFVVLIWIAFYFYFKNKDIKQDNIMLNILNLFENN